MKRWINIRLSLIVLVCLFLVIVLGVPVSAADGQRGISLSTKFPSISAGEDQDISFTINVLNTGPQNETLNISTSGPSGWDAKLVNTEYGTPYILKTIYVQKDNTDGLDTYFLVKPPKDAPTGDYSFVISARSQDGVVSASLNLTINLTKGTVTPAGGVKLNTTYPTLKGPAGSRFEFSVEVINQTNNDLSFDLSAQAPPNWELSFKPSYEEKVIQNIQMKANETKFVNIIVNPPQKVEAGDNPIVFRAKAGQLSGELPLMVIITGIYGIDLATSSGRLNASATAGKETTVPTVVYNSGSIPLQYIALSSSAPEGWTVTFNPDSVSQLAAGTIKEAQVTIKPASKTIAGDYELTLMAYTPNASDSLTMRVSVGTSTIWGWLGIAIVIIVIAALGIVFMRIGRR